MILAERAARDVERTARLTAEAAVAKARADRIVLDLELERLRFQLAKARREAFGQSSEAGARIGQFELALEDTEVTLAAMRAAEEMVAPATPVDAFTRRKPARRPLPAQLPRVRQVYPGLSACPCAPGACTSSAKTSPSRSNVSRRAGSFSSTCARSSPADLVTPSPNRPRPHTRSRGGALVRCCWPRSPSASSACICRCIGRAVPCPRWRRDRRLDDGRLDGRGLRRPQADVRLIEAHVLAALCLHVDDTPVPVLAKGKTKTGRLWTAVRDDHPFGGADPPPRFTSTRPTAAVWIPRRS